MGETSLASIMLFGYMSMVLLAAVFFRSQFKFLQNLFFPSAVLAGIFVLISGPSMLGIFNVPLGSYVDAFVFHLITAVFIILGLRGYSSPQTKRSRSVGTSTVIITKVMALQAAVGILIALLIALAIQPGLFAGFGSLLSLGFAFDPTVSLYFGGFWEESLEFSAGRNIAYSFAVLGYLVAYVLGLIMIAIAKKRGEVAAFPKDEDKLVLSGIADENSMKKSAGSQTTGAQSIDSLTLHLAIIGIVFLLTYSVMRLIARWMVMEFDPGVVIIAEIFMNFQFFFGFVFALLARRIMKFFAVEYILDEGLLNRSLGVATDYLVVAAIASIPLVISSVRLWEMLVLVIIGAAVTYLAVVLLSRLMFRDDDSIERRVALFGFLTGNISSSIALLRVVDPELRHPVARDLSFAGVLSLLLAIPLVFVINLPLIGEEVMYQIYAVLLSLAYIVILYVIWTLFHRRAAKKEEVDI